MKRDYEVSLQENTGLKIEDVYGYFSDELCGDSFKLTRIEFTNGQYLDVEGEHDFPYVVEGGQSTDIIKVPPHTEEDEEEDEE